VMTIVKALSGERIDIVPWDSDIHTFVSRALAPAMVSMLRVADWDERALEVIVAEDQLSLAIGKEGQNVRLAAKLTGWKIDLVTSELLKLREEASAQVRMEVAELEGVTPRLAEALAAAGYTTVQELGHASLTALEQIEGIGAKTAEKLQGRVHLALAALAEARSDYIERRRRELDAERRQATPLFNEERLAVAEAETEAAAAEAPPVANRSTAGPAVDPWAAAPVGGSADAEPAAGDEEPESAS
jgi:N utilization substance protein A